MIERLQRHHRGDESGFTLVELLVVIAILGILSAVVVFAVGGINDKGQGSACEIDTRTLQTAQEAAFGQNGAYLDEDGLVGPFISKASTLHDTATEDGTSYTITVADAKCGVVDGAVGTGDNK